MVNLLFACLSPRDIPQVLNEHPLLPCDILVIKYVPEWQAYFQAREFFLTHKEYTHLAIAADDIIVKAPNIRRLVRDLELFDYDVLTGMMNVEQDDLEILNITPRGQIPNPRHEERRYDWLKKKDVAHTGIIQVGFSGFPLMIIKRTIVEQIPFDADGIANGSDAQTAGSLDVMFCKNCYDKGIEIMVDTDVILMHLRREGKSRVGGANPDWYFRPKGSPDTFKDVRNKRILMKKQLEDFLNDGGLHNQRANDLLSAMVEFFLE